MPGAIMDQRFTPDVIAAAQRTAKQYGLFASICLAQWALESSYGTRVSGRFNFFGIKAVPGQSATLVATKEQNAQGVAHAERDAFANYASIADGFDAYGQFLSHSHYAPVRAAKSPDEAAEQLRKCGYATDVRYPDKLMSIIDANDLTRFDARPSVITPADRPPIKRVIPDPPPKSKAATAGKSAAGAVVVAGAGAAAYAPHSHWLWIGVVAAMAGAAVFAAIHWRK
jgi:hypothetical protein